MPGRIRPVRNAALHAPNIIVLIEEIDGTVSKHEYLYREIVVFSGWIFFDGVVWPFIDGGLVAIRKESDLYVPFWFRLCRVRFEMWTCSTTALVFPRELARLRESC